ncbi:MAG: OsmC family protein [Dehalococcoidia bacterium]
MPESVSVQVTLDANLVFNVNDDKGHEVVFDSSLDDGPTVGFSPLAAQLAAAAGCTAMDVISILRKMRQGVETYSVSAVGERQDEHPRVFTRIVYHHDLAGEVDEGSARRAIELSMTRYCPVSAMLRATMPITCACRVNGRELEPLEFPATHTPVG